MNKATSAYRQTLATTTSQGEVLLMLYDGAINFLNQAKERITAKDPAGKGILISKALDIINELDSTLNQEKGGSLSENLHNLYFFCNKHLLMANLRMDNNMIDEVIKILNGLRSAYASIQELPEAKAAGLEAAANQHAKATGTGRPLLPGPSNVSNAPGQASRRASLYGQNSSTMSIASSIAASRQPASMPPAQTAANAAPTPGMEMAQGATAQPAMPAAMPYAGQPAATATPAQSAQHAMPAPANTAAPVYPGNMVAPIAPESVPGSLGAEQPIPVPNAMRANLYKKFLNS